MDRRGNYLPLDSTNGEIRLLTLSQDQGTVRCTVETAFLDSGVDFVALSYCWGDANDTSALQVNGLRREVTSSLAGALRMIQYVAPQKKVWADALCIDQANAMEKNAQVRLMKDIYIGASLVYVWLGENDPGVDSFAQQAQGPYQSPPPVGEALVTSLLRARSILLRPWWERIWVVQEFVLPVSDPCFVCGPYTWTWSHLRSHITGIVSDTRAKFSDDELTQQAERILRRSGSVNAEEWSRMWKNYSELEILNEMRADYHRGVQLSVQASLIQTRRRLATDPRDKIFGLVGLFSDRDRAWMKIDYDDTMEQVCQQLMMTFWEHCNIINLMPMFPFVGASRSAEIASWTLDFSKGHPPAVAFLPERHRPDVWRQNPTIPMPLHGQNGQRYLRWSGKLAGRISSCCHFPRNARDDPGMLAGPLEVLRDGVQQAHLSRRPAAQAGVFESVMTEFSGHRDTLTGLLTGMPPDPTLDGRICGYIGKEWFVDMIRAVSPHSPTSDALGIVAFQWSNRIPEFPQTFSDLFRFVPLIMKNALGLNFFTTDSGRVGFTEVEIERGDLVVLLDAVECPVVLRVVDQGSVAIIGVAFVSGLMVPPGFEWLLSNENLEALDFVIC